MILVTIVITSQTMRKKNEDFTAEKILDWPVDAYSTLYIDGNNMLFFLNSTLRQNTLRRKKKRKVKKSLLMLWNNFVISINSISSL